MKVTGETFSLKKKEPKR